MSIAQLVGPYAKIERAEKHIKNLQSVSEEFARENSCKVAPEYNENAKRLSVVVRDFKDFPPEFGIIAGEALHQLRSALDHLVWQLFKHSNIEPPGRKTGFPIFLEGGKKYEDGCKSMIRGLSAATAARMERFQPFQRGAAAKEIPSWLLHDLNNTDKHRLALVTSAYMGHGATDFEIRPEIKIEKGRFYSLTVKGPLKNGAVLCWFDTDQREVTVNGKVAIAIALAEVGAAKNEPAVPLLSLSHLASHTRRVVADFEPDFA